MRFALLQLAICLVVLVPAVARAQSDDERYLAGLRQRRLFGLAETYCERELARAELPLKRQLVLTIEHSQTLAEHAVYAPPEESAALWDKATRVVEPFLKQHPDHPRAVLVRMQAAMVVLTRGETYLRRSEVTSRGEEIRQRAQQHLFLATRQLGQIVEELTNPRTRTARPKNADGLSESERYALESNVRYQLARGWRNLGRSYLPASADRLDALNQALKLLDPLAQRKDTERLVWQSRLDVISCYRLKGSLPDAMTRLQLLEKREPPGWVLALARAEQIRIYLAAEQYSNAIALATHASTQQLEPLAELDYVRLQTYFQAWEAESDAGNQAQAKAWQKRADELVKQIRLRHGAYWTRRAETLQAHYIAGSSSVQDAVALKSAAESFFRDGRYGEAIENYDKARQVALSQNQTKAAFEYGFLAATVEHQRKQHAAAAQRFEQLAAAFPEHPRASEAHFWGVYHSGRLLATKEQNLDDYVALLKEHLQKWPQGTQADQVRMRYGSVLESQKKWQEAARVYATVSPQFDDYAKAVAALKRCADEGIAQLREQNQNPANWMADMALQFEKIVLGSNHRWPAEWTTAQREAALSAADLWMEDGLGRYERAEKILNAALTGEPKPPANWQHAALRSRVIALTGQKRVAEASAVLEQVLGAALKQNDPSTLLNMVQGLARFAEEAKADLKRPLAEMQLQTIEKLAEGPGQLSEGQRNLLERTYARALLAAGRHKEGLTRLEKLAADHPRDGTLQEELALALVHSDDKTHWPAALEKWRALERRSQRGSDRWFRAKYYQALALYQLGQADQAAEIIRIAQVLTPALGGPTLKRRFLALLKKCQSQ